MKAKDLIKHLNDIDPSGEIEVVINNNDISHIGIFKAKDKGWYTKLPFDKYGNPSILSYIGEGYKIMISPMNIRNIFKSYPKIPIEIIGDDRHGVRMAYLESIRSKTRDLQYESKFRTLTDIYTSSLLSSTLEIRDDGDF